MTPAYAKTAPRDARRVYVLGDRMKVEVPIDGHGVGRAHEIADRLMLLLIAAEGLPTEALVGVRPGEIAAAMTILSTIKRVARDAARE